ncbi:TonB-dependent receptor [Altererythrobacter lauratis]|uniref:TonB-dependent receptor n=1 Tax=Alteraurantiacibacter lauratis TaxID=2054627 RepID=A0ABV7EG37_9SPHN
MIISARRALILSTPIWIIGAATGAQAQAAADDERAIIVTAQREAMLAQEAATSSRLGITALETPASVATLTGDELRARGDVQYVEAVTRAPGVTASSTPGDGNTALSIRGFGGHGSVMQLVNGVRMLPAAGTITFPFDTWNVERIEVLNGPASVLYGQGALGGVINVIPKTPNLARWEGDTLASYGSFDTFQLAAGLGGPITRSLGLRVDGSYRQSDGYVDRGDSNSLALSGALEFRPNDDLSVVLRHDFGDNEPMRYWGTPVVNGNTLDPSIRRENYNVGDAVIDWRDHRTQFSVDARLAEGLRVNSTSYRLSTLRRWENLESYSYNPATQTVARADNFGIVHDLVQWGNQTSLTLETPLSGQTRNTLVVGADLNWIDLDYSHSFATDPQNDVVPATGFDPGTFLDTVGLAPRYRTATRVIAFFAEDRLEITPRLSLVGGLRYEENRVGRWNYVYNPAGTQIIGETPALAGGTEAYKNFDHFTWRAGVVYEVTPELSLYGQYVTGVDPVGTLTTFTTSGAQFAFTNPTGNMVEAGVKGLLPRGLGQATLAVFRIVKNDLTVQRVTNGPLEQIGQQSSTGAEASLSLNLPFGLGLDANAMLIDAKYDDFASGAVDFTGNTPPGVPQASANASLRWDATQQLQLRSNLRWVGKRYTNNANDRRIPSFIVVDLAASYALTDNLAVDLRANNVFDTNYALSAYGSNQWLLAPPRNYSVAVRAAF